MSSPKMSLLAATNSSPQKRPKGPDEPIHILFKGTALVITSHGLEESHMASLCCKGGWDMWTHGWPREHHLCGRSGEGYPRSSCSLSHREARVPSDGEHKVEKPRV